ncbi:hypothetical protein GQR58_018757 [Nymphon striatum]|nr:hypothetical protein GQR58_018757 [Nymphon striatum]
MSTGFKSIRKAHTKNVLTPERSSTPLSSDEEIAMSKFPAKPAARPPPQGSLGQRDPHTPIQMRERISVTPRPANQPSPIGFPLTQKACVYDAVNSILVLLLSGAALQYCACVSYIRPPLQLLRKDLAIKADEIFSFVEAFCVCNARFYETKVQKEKFSVFFTECRNKLVPYAKDVCVADDVEVASFRTCLLTKVFEYMKSEKLLEKYGGSGIDETTTYNPWRRY